MYSVSLRNQHYISGLRFGLSSGRSIKSEVSSCVQVKDINYVRTKSVTEGICDSLKEVKLMELGLLPTRNIREFLDEL